MALMSE